MEKYFVFNKKYAHSFTQLIGIESENVRTRRFYFWGGRIFDMFLAYIFNLLEKWSGEFTQRDNAEALSTLTQ